MWKRCKFKISMSLPIIALTLFSSCTEKDLQMLEWMIDYYGGSQQTTGTSLKLIVRYKSPGTFVSGALIQVVGKDNDYFKQVQANSYGEVYMDNLIPGVYTIRAWKGNRWNEVRVYISGRKSFTIII